MPISQGRPPFPFRFSNMHEVNFRDALEQIVERDARYQREAYLFVREALNFTQKVVSKQNKDKVRHVTGQELLAGIREYALSQYGPMTHLLLTEWGLHSCQDFGEIVFNMVDGNLLAKTENDSRDAFKDGYDFDQAFRDPFRPTTPTPQTESKSQP